MKIGDRVKIKKFEEKPIAWDERFEGETGEIIFEYGGQFCVSFDKWIKPNRPDWGSGCFWENELEVI